MAYAKLLRAALACNGAFSGGTGLLLATSARHAAGWIGAEPVTPLRLRVWWEVIPRGRSTAFTAMLLAEIVVRSSFGKTVGNMRDAAIVASRGAATEPTRDG